MLGPARARLGSFTYGKARQGFHQIPAAGGDNIHRGDGGCCWPSLRLSARAPCSPSRPRRPLRRGAERRGVHRQAPESERRLVHRSVLRARRAGAGPGVVAAGIGPGPDLDGRLPGRRDGAGLLGRPNVLVGRRCPTRTRSLFGQAFLELQFYPDSMVTTCSSDGGYKVTEAPNEFTVCSPVWKINGQNTKRWPPSTRCCATAGAAAGFMSCMLRNKVQVHIWAPNRLLRGVHRQRH